MSGLASELLGFIALAAKGDEWAMEWARYQAAAIIAGEYDSAD